MPLSLFKNFSESQKEYVQGLRALLRGDREAAKKLFIATVKRDSDIIDGYIQLADIYRQEGDLGRSDKIYHDLLLRSTLTPAAKQEILQAFLKNCLVKKNLTQAEEVVKTIGLKNVPREQGDGFLGLYEESGRWDLALELLPQILSPKSAAFRRRLAQYWVEKSRKQMGEESWAEAAESLEKAHDADPGLESVYLYWGDLCFKGEKAAEALEWWEKLLEQAPLKSWILFSRLEKAYYEMGQYSKIGTVYLELTTKYPQYQKARLALARHLAKLGEWTSAAEHLHILIGQNPRHWEVHRMMINLYLEKGLLDKAMEAVHYVLEQITEREDGLGCTKCGYASDEPLWKCPRCGSWDSFPL